MDKVLLRFHVHCFHCGDALKRPERILNALCDSCGSELTAKVKRMTKEALQEADLKIMEMNKELKTMRPARSGSLLNKIMGFLTR